MYFLVRKGVVVSVIPPGGVSSTWGASQPQGFSLAAFEQEMMNAYLSGGQPTTLTPFVNDMILYFNNHPSITDPTAIENVIQQFLSGALKGASGSYPNAQDIYMQYAITDDPRSGTELTTFMNKLTTWVQQQAGLTWTFTNPAYTTMDADFNITVAWFEAGSQLPPDCKSLALAVQELIVQLGPGDNVTPLLQGEAAIIFSPTFFTTSPGIKEADLQIFLGSGFLDGNINYASLMYASDGVSPSVIWQWLASPSTGGAGLANSLTAEIQSCWATQQALGNISSWVAGQVVSPNFFNDNPNMTLRDFESFESLSGASYDPTMIVDYFNTGIYLAQNQGSESGRTRIAEALFAYMQQEMVSNPGITQSGLQSWLETWLANPANVAGWNSTSLQYPAQAGDLGFIGNLVGLNLAYGDQYAATCNYYYSNILNPNPAVQPLANLLLQDFSYILMNNPSGSLADVQDQFMLWFTNPKNYPSFFQQCPQIIPSGMQQVFNFVGLSIKDLSVADDFLAAGHFLYGESGTPDAPTQTFLQAIMAQFGVNYSSWTQADMQHWFNSGVLFDDNLYFFQTYKQDGVTDPNAIMKDLETYLFPTLSMFGQGSPLPNFFSNMIQTGMWLANNLGNTPTFRAVVQLYFTEMQTAFTSNPPQQLADIVAWMQGQLGSPAFYQSVFGAGPVVPAAIDQLATLLGQPTTMDSFIANLAQTALFTDGSDPSFNVVRDFLSYAGSQWPSGAQPSFSTWVTNALTNPNFFTKYPQADLASISALYSVQGLTPPNYLAQYVSAGQWLASAPSNPLAGALFGEVSTLLKDPTKTLTDLQNWGWSQISSPGFFTTYFGAGSALTQTDFNNFVTGSGQQLDPTFQSTLFNAGKSYVTAAAGDQTLDSDFINELTTAWRSGGVQSWQADAKTWAYNQVCNLDGSSPPAYPFGNYPNCSEAAVEAIEAATGFAPNFPPMQDMMFSFRAMVAKDTSPADQTLFANLYNDILKKDWVGLAAPSAVQTDFSNYFGVQDIAMQNWNADPAAWQDAFAVVYTGSAVPTFTPTVNDNNYIDMQKYLATGIPAADAALFTTLSTDLFGLGSTSANYTAINAYLQNYFYNPLSPQLQPETITKLMSYNFAQTSYPLTIALVDYQLNQYADQPTATAGMKGFALTLENELYYFQGSTPAQLQTFLENFFKDDICFAYPGVTPSDVIGFCKSLGITYSSDPNYYQFTQLDTNYGAYWTDFRSVMTQYSKGNVNFDDMNALGQIFVNIHNGQGDTWATLTNQIQSFLSQPAGLDPTTIAYLQAIAALPPP